MASAPLLTVGSVMSVSMNATWHGQRVLTTYKYQCVSFTGTPTVDDAGNQLCAQLVKATDLVGNFLACCPPQYFLVELWAQLIAPQRIRKLFIPVNASGTNTSISTTANLAAVITRRGIQASRRQIGSIHVPFPNLDDATSNGTVPGPLFTLLGNLAPFLREQFEDIAGTVWQPVLLRAKDVSIADAVPLSNTTVQTTVRTMRSRTVGHGK